MASGMTSIVIGLSAVIIAVRETEAVALTVRPHDAVTGEPSALAGLPFGPFDPDGHRTFELAVRAFVSEQTRFELGFVEQLYTFGDKGRDAPLADVGAGGARVISVGYLALAPQAAPPMSAKASPSNETFAPDSEPGLAQAPPQNAYATPQNDSPIPHHCVTDKRSLGNLRCKPMAAKTGAV